MSHTFTSRLHTISLCLLVAAGALCGCDSAESTTGDTGGSGATGGTGGTGGSGGSGGATGGTGGGGGTGGMICDLSTVTLPGDAVYPEGIALAADGRLFAGSLTGGQLFRSACAGTAEEFAAVDAPHGAIGMHHDDATGSLWVCGADSSTGASPAVYVLDGQTGALQAKHPFETGFGLCNDIAIAGDGTVYITESFGSMILRIAAADALTDAPASVWLQDPALAATQGAFGLNGVVVEGSSLYVVHSETGALFRAQIGPDGAPADLKSLTLSAPLSGPDGLRGIPGQAGKMLVAEGGSGRLSSLTVTGDMVQVELISDTLDYPTSVVPTPDGTAAWVVESQFDHLFGFDPNPPGPFELVRVALP